MNEFKERPNLPQPGEVYVAKRTRNIAVMANNDVAVYDLPVPYECTGWIRRRTVITIIECLGKQWELGLGTDMYVMVSAIIEDSTATLTWIYADDEKLVA